MAGRIILGIANPALDANGKVDSGATLTFYENGTTTPQSIYSDSTLATPLANPLTSDSAGRFPLLWGPDQAVYSIKWTLSSGSPITYDDIVVVGGVPGAVYGSDYGLSTSSGAAAANSVALNQALSDASALGLVYENPANKIIPLNAQITIPAGTIVRGNGGTWDFTNAAGSFPGLANVISQGSFTTLPALSSNKAIGDNSFPLASAPSLSPGNVVFISSTEVWNAAKSSYNKGEAVIVNNVSGSTFFAGRGLEDSYTAADTTLGKLNENALVFRDLTVLGDGSGTNSTVMLSHLGKASCVENITAHGPAAIQTFVVKRSAYANLRNINASRLQASGGSSTYAIAVVNSQNITINGGRCESVWHAFSIGGDSDPFNIVNRYVNAVGMTLHHAPTSSFIVAAADMHGNCQHCNYTDCTIYGGVELGGDDNGVRGATRIFAGSARGQSVSAVIFSETLSMRHTVEESVTVDVTGSSVSSYGLCFDADTPNGGLNSHNLGGRLRFYANCRYTIIGAPAVVQYLVNIENASATATDMDVDLSRAKFTFVSSDAGTVLVGGFSILGVSAHHIRTVVLPKARSTYFSDIRYVDVVDANGIESDCSGLGTQANHQLSNFSGTADFNGAKGFGGASDFLKAPTGGLASAVVNASGMVAKGYSGLAVNFDGPGSVLNVGTGQLSGLGITATNFDTVYYTPGPNDGSITHTSTTTFKTATFA